jgi:class 3 adenylate cyclase
VVVRFARLHKTFRPCCRHGGEILKFIGDGLLAIFPLAAFEGVADAARNAMAAAHEALAAVHAIEHESLGSESLKMVVALHYGTVIYGNIGAAGRLDFTVIGPSVNLVSRIEAAAKSLDLPLVVSDDFARAHGGALRSLGLQNCAASTRRTSCSSRRRMTIPDAASDHTLLADPRWLTEGLHAADGLLSRCCRIISDHRRFLCAQWRREEGARSGLR